MAWMRLRQWRVSSSELVRPARNSACSAVASIASIESVAGAATAPVDKAAPAAAPATNILRLTVFVIVHSRAGKAPIVRARLRYSGSILAPRMTSPQRLISLPSRACSSAGVPG